MVASGLVFWKPATHAWVAACWVLAPAPEIVPETAAEPDGADPPEDPVSLNATQPARSTAPVVAMPTAASRVFTISFLQASVMRLGVAAHARKLCETGGRQRPYR